MLQKVNRLLTILIYSLIGVYIGCCIYTYADYRARPGLYALYSAPWYTQLLVCGACITKEKTYPWGTDDLVKTYKCLVFWRSDRVYMCVERFVELSTNEYRCCPEYTWSIGQTLESFTEMSEQQFVDKAYNIWCNGAR